MSVCSPSMWSFFRVMLLRPSPFLVYARKIAVVAEIKDRTGWVMQRAHVPGGQMPGKKKDAKRGENRAP